MNDPVSMLKYIHRPRLLIRAARFGVTEYNRQRDLRRLLKVSTPPSPGQAIMQLMNEESLQEEKRKTGDAGYSITRHVSLLIALMGEARLRGAGSD